MTRTALVTGIGGPAGRNVTQLFLNAGWRVVGVDMQPQHEAHWSSPNFSFRKVSAASDPTYLRQLRQLIEEHGVTVVVPTVSEELPLVATGVAELPALVSISSSDAVSTANDKYLTWQRLSTAGIPVPIALLIEGIEDPELAVRELGTPFISKPRVGRGGRSVLLHHEARELEALHPSLMLQSFAPGTEYTVNLFCGEPEAVVVVLEKLELKEGRTGNAVRTKRVTEADVAELASRTARTLGLAGLIDMDIRRAADGTPQLIEVNARAGANIAYAPEAFNAFLTSLKGAAWNSSHSSSTSLAV